LDAAYVVACERSLGLDDDDDDDDVGCHYWVSCPSATRTDRPPSLAMFVYASPPARSVARPLVVLAVTATVAASVL